MEDKKISFKKFLPGIAWFFIVGVLTLMPGSDVPKIGWLNITYFDKIVHAVLFGGLTLSFYLPFITAPFSLQKKMNHFIRISLAAIIWGITIEFIQKFYVSGRSFDLLDWAADTAGVLIAFWICRKMITSKFYGK